MCRLENPQMTDNPPTVRWQNGWLLHARLQFFMGVPRLKSQRTENTRLI
jgi:hypothetical protein